MWEYVASGRVGHENVIAYLEDKFQNVDTSMVDGD